MAKRAKKRRAWSSSEVRELKAMAKKKTPAGKIALKVRPVRRRSASDSLSTPVDFLQSGFVARTGVYLTLRCAAGGALFV
jgi:hypothetical protein